MSAAEVTAAELVIEVIGTPAPQGSKTWKGISGGRGIMIESSKAVAPWRDSVAYAARAAMPLDWQPLDGPLCLDVTFRLARPKSAPKSRTRPFQRPDLSKLVRSTEDALTTAGVWCDDAQVVDLHTCKVFAGPGSPMGAAIVVRRAVIVPVLTSRPTTRSQRP